MMSSADQRQYLQLLGIDVWVERGGQPANDESAPQSEEQSTQDGTSVGSVDWADLQKQVLGCTNCELHTSRKQTVFGCGDPAADWMIIGEAPGAEEDRQGEPFVGRAGQLLNSMLQAIGLQREQVYIANILKCRPPNNRDPKAEEVAHCESYLRQQIMHIQPKIILALGRVAAQNLLKVDTPIGKMRGRDYVYPETDIPVVVSYHPAYLLRSPAEKRKSWQDLQMAMATYRKS